MEELPARPRRVWATFHNGTACRPALLLESRIAWIDDDFPEPKAICSETGVCTRIARSSRAFRATCPTCPARVLYRNTLLLLEDELDGVPPYVAEVDGAELAAGPPLFSMPGPPPDIPRLKEIAWGEYRSQNRDWSLEASAEAGLLAGAGFAAGVSGRLGFRYFDRYSDKSPTDGGDAIDTLAAIATFGLLAIPADGWAGNDTGADFRAHMFGDGAGRPSVFAVGVAPGMRVTPGDGRVRYPSALGILIPEVGITFGRGLDVEPYVGLLHVPCGVWLGRHLGLDLEPGLFVGRAPWAPRNEFPTVSFSFTVGLVGR
jgi:hypothetical protein